MTGRSSRAKSAQVATKAKARTTRAVADPHEHLRQVDRGIAKWIEQAGPCPLPERAKSPPDAAQSFRSLVNAIVSQQLSGKAADTIIGRVEALGGGTLPGPKELLAIADDTLRAAGLSGAKTRGVKDLAARVLDGSLDLAAIHGQDDESIIEELVKVRGIGRWTAEMFLMFRLGRLDILSTGDLGLRKGLMILNGLSDLPDPATMEKLTDHWRPFRSVGSWYLWRVAEGAPPHRTKPPTEKKAVAKKAVAKKAVTKKAVTKKAVTKKAVTKKAVAKKAVAKKAVAKKAVTKKAVTKKAVSAR